MNAIVMGDSLHDLDIAKNLEPKNLLKIGFFNKDLNEESK